MCGPLESGQKELVRNDVLALGNDVEELRKVAERIERDYRYVFHGFTFFNFSRLRARNRSFEKSFAALDEILLLLDRHVERIGR